jgi:hypothetical protein
MSRIFERFQVFAYAIRDTYHGSILVEMVFQSVPSAAPASNPNSLGFDPSSHPERNLVNLLVMTSYSDPALTDGLSKTLKEFVQGIDQTLEKEGVKDAHLYMNYASSWQDVLKGYGQENMAKMRAVARKYDEKGMFQRQVKGGFKLFTY